MWLAGRVSGSRPLGDSIRRTDPTVSHRLVCSASQPPFPSVSAATPGQSSFHLFHGLADDACLLSHTTSLSKMVLLTMTPSIVEALQTLNAAPQERQRGAVKALRQCHEEPPLKDPAVGKPVSHSQIVDIWSSLTDAGYKSFTLEMLLRGSKIYVPPPAPKPQPVRHPR